MSEKSAPGQKLDDLPLWRLLVALADAEATAGASSPSARVLARAVEKKLGTTRIHYEQTEKTGGER